MDPMLESFIGESRENLETAGRCFLELEKTPGDQELMNDLFRAMHTMKGSSGLFDIPSFTKVVHAAEDVLYTIRSGTLEMTSRHIDTSLEAMDQISAWLKDLEDTGALAEGSEAISQSLTQNLRLLLEVDATKVDVTADVLNEPPDWLPLIPEKVRQKLFKSSETEALSIIGIEYRPDPQSFFSGIDPLHTMRSLPGLFWLHIQAREAWPDPAVLDPYHCNLMFYVIAIADENEIYHYLRYITEQTQLIKLLPSQLVSSVEASVDVASADVTEIQSDAASEVLAVQQKILTLPCSSELLSGRIMSVATVVRNLLNVLKIPTTGLEQALAATDTQESAQPLARFLTDLSLNPTSPTDSATTTALNETELASAIQILSVQQKILTLPCPGELFLGRIASISTVIQHLLNAVGIPTSALIKAVEVANEQESAAPLVKYLTDLTLHPATTEKKPPEVSILQDPHDQRQNDQQTSGHDDEQRQDTLPATEIPVAGKTLKVDQQRIDALMDLVGELVVAKNALPFLAKRAEEVFGVRQLAKEIKAQSAIINRLSEELQSAVMQIRMVPVATVFQRFPRLVRDLSRKLNKKIQLVLEGEDTEADKNVVEELNDPLIHLVRNSLDHGLETVIEREAVGKPAEGVLILRATPHEDQVVIEIIDDGRGIDPEVIKRKAYEQGIIDEQRLETISDQETLQLIFAAGFSTADVVSDLSGRGVGMDVVRSVASQAGGAVVVESELGQGTTIRLSLPLSMAVSRVMMVEVDQQLYGISMENIVEMVRVPSNSIKHIKQSEAVVLRNRLIPLFYLRQLMQLAPQSNPQQEKAIVVMTVAGEDVGLVIDEFHEGVDLIQKPLEGVMANYAYYSAAALLGDGRVLLVLNMRELLACR